MLAHSRLSRLALIFALAVLPALTTAQTPNIASQPSSPSKDMVLFNFDGGNYDGWTLSGDCWNTQPATAKTFVDRQGNSLVLGIVGTGFLISQYKNPAATGKAVSRDFTIDRPFLNFKIGGGHFPNQACLNLVIDGKIVRSKTGNDSTELRPASWDVYAFIGKTAHLEVVDATPVPNRGYIMVDEIVLASFPTDLKVLDIESGPTLSRLGLQPFF